LWSCHFVVAVVVVVVIAVVVVAVVIAVLVASGAAVAVVSDLAVLPVVYSNQARWMCLLVNKIFVLIINIIFHRHHEG